MAYNFLGLVNDVNRRINETPLDDTNFATSKGYYNTAKDAVNNAIHEINQDAFQWPFNYIEQEDILTPGDTRYDWPVGAKNLDWNNFRIKRNATFGNVTQHLKRGDYEEYVEKYIDDEYNTGDTGIRQLPQRIYQAPGLQYIVHPVPDKAYDLVYEYYQIPIELELYSDVPSVPSDFRHVIVDGAMGYVFSFRNNEQSAQISIQKFRDGIDNMRRIYTARVEDLRDTRVHRGL